MPPEETAPAPDKSRSKWELCIMRHGAAVPLGAEGYADDSKRPLTPDGKKKMQKISKGLRRLGFAADWIVSSPLLRAVETAEIVAATLGTSIPVDFSDTLSPGGPPEALLAFLAKHEPRSLKAMRARHTYAATDNIIADWRCGEHMQGDEFKTDKAPEFRLRLQGTAGFNKVTIVKDDVEVKTFEPKKQNVELTWSDPNPASGKTSYYYARGEQEDGELVWASPMWIEFVPNR